MADFALPAAYLCAVNALCFAAFAYDKHLARVGKWRISERTLLVLVLAGGTPAAYAARHFVRHKTRKQPFVALLHVIALLQVTLVIVAVTWLDSLVAR
ncbi:hypothetical protein ANOBCDAF_03095 [Pleomorphomonas sp. T1.2MG-36]|uniref:DUF1294 domain-containing protein n=1 Tax=Pleomorphomonas sp. T1.2MG-36 TaxID=3041167 RepID=UPI002477444D|nr:DUF1294 domain-containing protein [Pleomorphomonas sp. T1.2MG-36]CAI9414015.1 hypothetical protein ANOBCDAF_03095 [Pleomorphomonas sp. T1.2MG-36]